MQASLASAALRQSPSMGTTALAQDLGLHAPRAAVSAAETCAAQADATLRHPLGSHASLAAAVEGLLGDKLRPPHSPRSTVPLRSGAVGSGASALQRSPRAARAAAKGSTLLERTAVSSSSRPKPQQDAYVPTEAMVLWKEPVRMSFRWPEHPGGGFEFPSGGLGSIQPSGRTQVLHQFLQPEQSSLSGPSDGLVRPSSLLKASTAGGQVAGDGAGNSELEWSSLTDESKQALRQWVEGKLGGRHCMLMLEHSGGSSPDEPSMVDLRGGAALNVLSGLHAEGGLAGASGEGEGGWIFDAVFSKPAQQALQEGLQAAVDEIADPKLAQVPGDLTAEQAHLALRRLALKAQYKVNAAVAAAAAAAPEKKQGGPQGTEEYTRVQVWLELLRLHAGGVTASPSPAAGAGAAAKGRSKGASAAAPSVAPNCWHDGGVLRELGKAEADIEAESLQMSIDELRAQNRAIEEYVVKLVRQRDELKQLTKLAEERDSYYILGLEGPAATDAEVRKAYRNLARKEHPDKAGQANKRRFQAIQQAYNNIQQQRKDGGGGSAFAGEGDEEASTGGIEAPSAAVGEAARFAGEAKEAAERVVACAHRSLRAGEEAAEAQALPKRRAFRTLRELTRQGVSELKDAAAQLRILGRAVDGTVRCLESALAESKDSGTSVAAIGLRDRAVMVEDAGRSSVSSAELLEKIAEATEAILRKVDAADATPEPQRRSAPSLRGPSDDSGNLLRLGTRLLGESLARIAAVARRSADEAIAGAMKALDLSRGLTSLDFETRRERRGTKKARFDEDAPMAAPDAPKEGEGQDAAEADGDGEKEEDETGPPPPPEVEKTPREKLESAAKRVKERHVALRVKNLAFLASLNEEALKAQKKLRELLERSEGALLPEVSIAQKEHLFELVGQLLDAALAECTRLASQPGAPPARVMDRCFSFVLALEHGKEIAMPADSRTQALKLAILVDVGLLCQIVEGPLRRRLVAAGAAAKRRESSGPGYGLGALPTYAVRSRSSGLAGVANAAAAAAAAAGGGPGARAWEEAAQEHCNRIVQIIKQVLVVAPTDTGEANGQDG